MHAAWIGAALFVVTLAMYWPSLDHQFIDLYDDNLYVTQNERVKEGLHAENVYYALTNAMVSNWHPLTMLSHMLDVDIHGLNPRGHHLTNILLHSAATLLLFLLLMQLTQSKWSSAMVAALFALHPMHVESVAWIAERKDVLSACLWFLTTIFYVRYTQRPGLRRYWPVLFFFALGLMAKPMLVTLPFTLLLLDYWPLNRISRERAADIFTRKTFALVTEKLPLFAMAFAASAVTVLVQSESGAMTLSATVPHLTRLATVPVSYVAYIVKTIWLADYAVFYPHSKMMPPLWQVFGALLIIAAVTVFALWRARKQPFLAVGWFWFLGTLVPVIGIVQVGLQSIADRYSYIPSIGLFIVFVWGVLHLMARTLGRPVAIACSVLIILSIAVTMRLQLGHWRDSETLFRHAVAVTESNFTANYALGAALKMQRRFAEAEPYLAEAVRLWPDNVNALMALGDTRGGLGRLSGAYECFTAVERLDPGKGIANYTMGMILEEMGRPDEANKKFEKAIADYRILLENSPDDPFLMINLAMALESTAESDEALSLLREALRLAPNLFTPKQAEDIRNRTAGTGSAPSIPARTSPLSLN